MPEPSWPRWATACSALAAHHPGPQPCKTSSEPQLRAKASGMLGPQRENALFPPKQRSALFSSPFYKSSAFPGENTVHGQSDVSMEHQRQKQIICHQTICHQTFFLSQAHTVPPQVSLTQDSWKTAQLLPNFLLNAANPSPELRELALNPCKSSSWFLPQFPHQDKEDEQNT